ncbi:TonB-dependent receptor [Telmatobacter bradus]|uniref:TonB-dependent receptor n=1 Tax=Telmatobacter bradus TaxID=474953 RepID=UPI003B43C117
MLTLQRLCSKWRQATVLLCLLASFFPVFAQSSRCVLAGTVVDGSGAVLKGVQITVLPINKQIVSDANGAFTVSDLQPGHFKLVVSSIGFDNLAQEVDLKVGQTTNLELRMNVASQKEEVVVTAERVHGEADAINVTRTADNILQVLPAEVITSLPNANVADALGRMSSITLYRSEGEGEYIQVRGTEPRLTNVTVDGITIPAPEPTVRQVRLDVIPSEIVESVQINKTLSASQDANGIGGSADLRLKTASEHPTLILFTNGGYTPILNGRASSETGGNYGQRFGKTKRFGLMLDGSYDYNGRGIDNFQPAIDPLSTFFVPFYDNNTIRDYRYYRYRTGIAGAADYRINSTDSIYAHGFYTDLKDWGDKWYYEPISTALSCPTGDTCNNGANVVYPSASAKSSSPKFYTSSKRPNASVGTLILGGHHAIDGGTLAWQLSGSRAYMIDSAGNPKADFSWIGPSVYCNYIPSQQTSIYRPVFGNCDGANSILEHASYWAFKDITTSTGKTGETDLTAQASYIHNYSTHGHFGVFEAGFKISNAHKAQDATETVYDGWSTSSSSPVATMTGLQSGFDNTDYFKGQFLGGNFGPVSDFNKVQAFTLKNLPGDIDEYKTVSDTWPNIFHFVERIPAGYVMNTIDFGRLHMQTGLRIEATQMNTFGYYLQWAASTTASGTASAQPSACANGTITGHTNCYVASGYANNPSYVDVLPSVQLRYALTPAQNLRLVYARGVARPDPYQLVPYTSADDTANTASIGNPSLRPEHANNYDLLYENFLHPLGMIQAGVFVKQLTAPQVEFQIPSGVNVAKLPAGTIPAWMLQEVENAQSEAGSTASVTQYVNGQNSYLYGFEISYQQHMSYLPSLLSGLGISANYSYTASQMKGLWLRSDQPRLIDQATNTWNLSPTYDYKRLSVRAGLSYNGKSLFSYNWISPTLAPGAGADPSGLGATGPSGDVWTLAHYQVDAQGSYRIWKGLTAVVSGLNLNNEVFGYYTGSNVFVNQREYYKPTYTGGLRYNFNSLFEHK